MNSEMNQSSAIRVELEKLNLSIIRANEVDDFIEKADRVSLPSWPEFMMHDQMANQFWYPMHKKFPDYHFALIENTTGKWIAVGNSIPVSWTGPFEDLPDEGWDWALQAGMADDVPPPNMLCALAIQVHPDYRGRALSTLMIKIMKDIGQQFGFDQLIAPVRPNKKCDYPLVPMDEYITWTREGESFDPWLRVHERLGAKIIKVCPRAMLISGSIQEWQEWTGLSFQASGEYPIPGSLVNIKIDVENDQGVYVEPNVWMLHKNDNY